MGCAASNNAPEAMVFATESKILDVKEESIKAHTSSSKYSNDSSPFCEYDDEFREIRRSRTESIETVSTYSASTVTHVTIDTPYIINDKDFVVLRSSIVSTGSESEENLKNYGEGQRYYVRSGALSIGAILNARTAAVEAVEADRSNPIESHWWNQQSQSLKDFDAVSPPSLMGNTLPHVFLRTLSLPGTSDDLLHLPEHLQHLHNNHENHVPFSSVSVDQAEEEVEDKLSIAEHRDRESVLAFVNKIEVLTLELRSKIQNSSKIDLDAFGKARSPSGRSRSLQSMSPLSPQKNSHRRIENIGKYDREKFVVGSFKEDGHVKGMVKQLQSPSKSSNSLNNNLNGFFKPMNRPHRKLVFSPEKLYSQSYSEGEQSSETDMASSDVTTSHSKVGSDDEAVSQEVKEIGNISE